jgi:formate dehydrogenase accessory protein FdhD
VKKRLKMARPFSRIILSACHDEFPSVFLGKRPRVESSLTIKAETILQCVNRLNTDALLFRKTGGVHVAAVFDGNGNVAAFAEDVGRHNAVDKAIGMGALNKTDFGSSFLVLSGRLTGDIVLKAARVGLPMLASLAAAVDAGIAVARDTQITLIGFVRGHRMNIYNLPERICV